MVVRRFFSIDFARARPMLRWMLLDLSGKHNFDFSMGVSWIIRSPMQQRIPNVKIIPCSVREWVNSLSIRNRGYLLYYWISKLNQHLNSKDTLALCENARRKILPCRPDGPGSGHYGPAARERIHWIKLIIISFFCVQQQCFPSNSNASLTNTWAEVSKAHTKYKIIKNHTHATIKQSI